MEANFCHEKKKKIQKLNECIKKDNIVVRIMTH